MDLELKQGEAKTITFRLRDKDTGEALDLTGCTFELGVRSRNATTALIVKDDSDFDKSQAASGIVSVFLTSTDTNQAPGDYIGELKTVFTGTPSPIDKSDDFVIKILRATVD